ncbi:MAG: MarR family transcriptional regulator [Myxococcota bacterium]|nr:MarR family transcriptional regulator [Myxococcota bacterium]
MSLRLGDQLCFPLYAAARAVQQRYRPLLSVLGLTYPQYLVMMVLWEEDAQSVSALGRHLMLDSGTLTPLLKRLETAGLLERRRMHADGRIVTAHLTAEGRALRARAADVPGLLAACLAPAAGDFDVPEFKRSLDHLLRILEEAP